MGTQKTPSVSAKPKKRKPYSTAKKRMAKLKKAHAIKKPDVHFDDCPACNPSSTLTYDEYILKVRRSICGIMFKKRMAKIAQKKADSMPAKDFAVHDRPLDDWSLRNGD